MRICKLIYILVFCSFLSNFNSSAKKNDQNLKRKLIKEYKNKALLKNAIPIKGNGPLKVIVQLHIMNMVSVEHIDMHYHIFLNLKLSWKDFRLIFSNVKSGQGRNNSMPFTGDIFETFWIPDLFFPLAKKTKLLEVTKPNRMLLLEYDGTMRYEQRMAVAMFCHMDLRLFPFDRQECSLSIQSREFDALTVTFHLYRQKGYYMIHMYIPCILIVILSWVAFWIDYKAISARVSFGATNFLNMVSLGTSILSSFPPVDYVKSIDIYVFFCILITFLAFIEFVLVGISQKKWKVFTNKFQIHKKPFFGTKLRKNSNWRRVDIKGINKLSTSESKELTNLSSISIKLSGKPNNDSSPIEALSHQSDSTSQPTRHRQQTVHKEQKKFSRNILKKFNRKHRVGNKLKESSKGKRKTSILKKFKKRKESIKEKMREKQSNNQQIHIIDAFMRKIYPIIFILFNIIYFMYLVIN